MQPLALLLTVMAALSGSGADAPASDRAEAERPRAAATSAQIGLVDWQERQLAGERSNRLRYVVVRDVDPRTRRSLRRMVRANPRTRVLLYTNAGFMIHHRSDASCDFWPFNGDGVDWCRADRRHEDWFLHSAESEERLRSSGYRSSWAADIGEPGYRRAWVANTLKRLRGRGLGGSRTRVAGVFMDDVNLQPGHGLDGRIAEYEDAEYGAQAAGFAAQVARRLDRAGFLAVANTGFDVHDPAQRGALIGLAPHLDAIAREQFTRYDAGDDVFTTPALDNGNDWLTELELFEAVQAAGGAYLGITYGNEPRGGLERTAAAYARATFLVGWDGASPSALAFRTLDRSDPADFAGWQTEIGVPSGPRAQVGDGHAYMRPYSAGVAIANADPQAGTLAWLPGLHRPEGGVCTPAVYLPPASGRVLERC